MKNYTNDGKVEVLYDPDHVATQQARDIMDRLLPQWAVKFLGKNRKYKAVGNSLGARGVFPDVHRKTGILKDRIWDGNGVVGEGTREVIEDLIGHLFLMLHMIDDEPQKDAEWDLAHTGPVMTLEEGQGYALDRAADRMVNGAWQPPKADSINITWEYGEPIQQRDRYRFMSFDNALAQAWERGASAARAGMDVENPYGPAAPEHEYDELMNCVKCGHAHVGPDSNAYQTTCPGRPYQSRPEMTVSERLEKDGGRH